MAKKSSKSTPAASIAGAVRSRILSWLLVGGLAAAGAIGFYFLWQRVGPRLVAQDEYRLDYDEIEVTPTPEWIRADVKREVLRDASLDSGLSLFDEAGAPPLVERLAQAFGLHPWVERVVRVDKRHPASVNVELAYRRPVCMVEVPGGLYPIDGAGVVLPTGDFMMNRHRQLEALRYPRLTDVGTLPSGLVGQPWGDPRVTGGAKIAAVLLADWELFGLSRITPAESAAGDREPNFTLHTTRGARIAWGHAPGSEGNNEIPAADKLARLKRYVTEHGSLDAGDAPRELDLRPWQEVAVQPTAPLK